MNLPLAALAGLWRGEFATLWRTPPGYDDGAPVDWLSARCSPLRRQSRRRSAPTSSMQRCAPAQCLPGRAGLKPDGRPGR